MDATISEADSSFAAYPIVPVPQQTSKQRVSCGFEATSRTFSTTTL